MRKPLEIIEEDEEEAEDYFESRIRKMIKTSDDDDD